MSHINVQAATSAVNFIDTPVGLVRKTVTVAQDDITADEKGYKIVPAGTIYPANDATAQGILYDDVDVTDGDHEGSLIVAGRIIKENLPVEPAETVKIDGITFVSTPAVTR